MSFSSAGRTSRGLALVVAAGCVASFVGGCQTDGRVDEADKSPGKPAHITFSLKENAKVALDQAIRVGAEHGTLSAVTVRDHKGRTLRGAIDALGASWVSSEGLRPNARYQVEARAINLDGKPTASKQTFQTERPKRVLSVAVSPGPGEVVGAAMPVVVKFSKDIGDRAAVERRLKIDASNAVTGSWRWFGAREVHYRPKRYWPGHTNVAVKLYLSGLRVGRDVWGAGDKTVKFRIGRQVVTKVNLFSHYAKVYIDGKLERSIPVTGGKPGWRTRRGIKVILERRTGITFTNEAIGAREEYTLHSAYGLRTTWSGEFIHTAWWSTGSQGYSNTSHGCIGMNTRNSRWLWKVSQVGDPVEVRSSGSRMPVTGNGIGDWNLPWSKWRNGSALDW